MEEIMRRPIIAGNWKMNKTQSETVKLLNEILNSYETNDVEAVVCVPFTSIPKASELLKDVNIGLGAQNMYYENSGAFTGEVSPEMLIDLNVKYVILGHSERREIFKETDELINAKIKSAISHDLVPIICVGETLEEREAKSHEAKVKGQIVSAFEGIDSSDAAKTVVAYEPIWAIGTGVTATSEDANSMCGFIRKTIGEIYDDATAEAIRIQYGGSVKPDNVTELMNMSDIDGALVGGASLKADSFLDLINF